VLRCLRRDLVTALVGLGGQKAADLSAHGVIDQQFETAVAAMQILASEPAGQEFTPAATTIVAADVRLKTMNRSPDTEVVLRIRSGSIAGPVLASAIRTLPQGFDGWAHFELSTAVAATPGQTYVLELDSSNDTHGWAQGTNEYAGGKSHPPGAARGRRRPVVPDV
jgi:hypothetical protein